MTTPKPAPVDVERCVALLRSLLGEFDGAVYHHENRGKGGQHVSFYGDFANVAPSAVGRMRWWAREMRQALGDSHE